MKRRLPDGFAGTAAGAAGTADTGDEGAGAEGSATLGDDCLAAAEGEDMTNGFRKARP